MINLRYEFHHHRIKPKDIFKTTLRTRYDHYELTVMPFDLTNAAAALWTYI